MLINVEKFKDVCKTILAAIDSHEATSLVDTLELKAQQSTLYLNVTNKEYYVSAKFPLDFTLSEAESFKATINAALFLKLITAITSENLELTLKDTYVNVKASGNYKIPLIYENDHLMEVPEITIVNKTAEMDIPINILQTIVSYNSKQLNTGSIAQPVQKMFYIDEEGCITFTLGACVNNFTLPTPIKVLLNLRLVNLFKLFKDEPTVHFSLGYDPLNESLIQTKVSFETSKIKLTAITGCNDDLINKVPAAAIRSRANKEYLNKVVLKVSNLNEAFNRLLLFSDKKRKEETRPFCSFKFTQDSLTICDSYSDNTETLNYQNDTVINEPYEMILDVNAFKKILEGCTEQYITLNFGDRGERKACVITRGAIKNVIPEAIASGK